MSWQQLLLGIGEDAEFTADSFDLAPGDPLLCVIDGVTERRNGGRELEDDGLAEVLRGCTGMGAMAVAERVRQATHEFGPDPVADDLAILSLHAVLAPWARAPRRQVPGSEGKAVGVTLPGAPRPGGGLGPPRGVTLRRTGPTVLAEIDGHRVLFDPVWGERCSPFAFAVPLGVGAHLERWGLRPDRFTELDWHESAEVAGLTLTAAPARHFCGRGLRNRQRTLWASWVVAGSDHRVFHSGDTGYFPGFADTGSAYGPFDATMIQVVAHADNYPALYGSYIQSTPRRPTPAARSSASRCRSGIRTTCI